MCGTCNVEFTPATTTAPTTTTVPDNGWNAAKVASETVATDPDKCYYAIFYTGSCEEGSVGGVYKMDASWGDNSANFDMHLNYPTDCGTVVENWATSGIAEPLLDALEAGEDFDIFSIPIAARVADYDCNR